MGTIREKWYGPTEAEDIMKQWQEYTEELYKKDLHNPDKHDDNMFDVYTSFPIWNQSVVLCPVLTVAS